MIATDETFLPLINAIRDGEKKIRVQGLTGSSSALFLSRINRPLVIITSAQEEAERLYMDIRFFMSLFPDPDSTEPLLFPSLDILPHGISKPDPKILGERIKVLSILIGGESLTLITHIDAITGSLPGKSEIENKSMILRPGDSVNRDTIGERLTEIGYRRVPMVAETGEFSTRGGIIDIYSPYHSNPIRIDLFGDEIESIREFDQGTQRSIKELDEGILLPLLENTGSLKETVFDYLPEECIVVLDEPLRLNEWFDNRDKRNFTLQEIERRISRFQLISLELLGVSRKERAFTFETESIESQMIKGIPSLAERLKEWKGRYKIFITCNTKGQAERLRDLLIEYEIDCLIQDTGIKTQDSRPKIQDSNPLILIGRLSKGFVFPSTGLVFISESEIFGEKVRHRAPSKSRLEDFLKSIEEIRTGDYIVHVDYGIGRYLGIKRLRVDSYESDFLLINYAGDDKLYLPLDRIDRVQRYVGPEGSVPELNRLGGISWQRTKERVRKEMEEMAGDLLHLYASREVLEGYPFSTDDYIHREFDASFEYEETPDQTTAIEDVKKDMEGRTPMDRLICGDVGYGKTEVAMRASFKAVHDGKQVAILVPTTLLAEQHYQTFSERFSAFPVRIEVLSRFKTRKEQIRILNELESGTIDIIIGTHRLLQKDIRVKNLGILIVDEEQRFGVRHKERLKELKKNVDVLTLTATPIPRTLHMALSRVRDLSIISTPPEDRLSVKTIITPFDRRAIRDAILREMARGGQVFFVHNRVKTLDRIFRYLRKIVPEARVGIAHGQMKEKDLEKVMVSFLRKEIDLLLSSAIIESGLDIPSANTIIINHADRFGLSDLYQLRGRVGRSNRRAYAYFIIPGRAITEDARKRLRAIQELSELGAGFKIAMRDLEIRGAGNLLGPEQSGHIAAVGLDLYIQMLERAVMEIKGEDVPPLEDPLMDMKVSAFISEDYIPDVAQRLSIYRRVASAKSGHELKDIHDEIRDRFGEVPEETRRLLDIMELKILARTSKIKKVERERNEINIVFNETVRITPEVILGLLKREQSIRLAGSYTLQIKIDEGDWTGSYSEIKKFLQEILECVTKGEF